LNRASLNVIRDTSL